MGVAILVPDAAPVSIPVPSAVVFLMVAMTDFAAGYRFISKIFEYKSLN